MNFTKGLLIGFIGFMIGFTIFGPGQSLFMRMVYDEPCYCGESRPCAFAPGIVGVQACDDYQHEWGKCVP